MSIQEKLHAIQRTTHETQAHLAERFGVSLVSFNRWWNGKAVPRQIFREKIEEYYLESTGQKSIAQEILSKKKQKLFIESSCFPHILQFILENPDIHDEFVLKLTYNSNRIEGSTLTEGDTAAVLFENVALPYKSLTEQLEAKNHQTALNFVFEYLNGKGRLDENFILKLHSILMNGIRSDAGQYRTHGVRILGVNLPTANFLKIPEILPPLLEKASRKTADSVAHATSIHAQFEQIHPFSDGNGRVGRLLMNAMLLQENLPPAIIQEHYKPIYYSSLYRAQTQDDISRLQDFLLDAIFDGLKILKREPLTPSKKFKSFKRG